MKSLTLVSLALCSLLGANRVLAETRSVFLNGVDISSTKNQSMQQVNITIDSQGNVYIEAPHYEAQQESTFVPLGRQGSITARIPQHKAPGALPTAQTPAQQALAPEGDSRDTLDTVPTSDGLQAKEGTRIQGNDDRPGDAGGKSQQNPAKDSSAR